MRNSGFMGGIGIKHGLGKPENKSPLLPLEIGAADRPRRDRLKLCLMNRRVASLSGNSKKA